MPENICVPEDCISHPHVSSFNLVSNDGGTDACPVIGSEREVAEGLVIRLPEVFGDSDL